MRLPTTPERARSAVRRAIGAPHMPTAVGLALAERVARIDGAGPEVAALERAGLSRAARSHIEAQVDSVTPNWLGVRALHRLWVASVVWSKLAGDPR